MKELIIQLNVLKLNIPNRRYGAKQELRELLYKFNSILHDFSTQNEHDRNGTMWFSEEAMEISIMIEGIAVRGKHQRDIDYFNRTIYELESLMDSLIVEMERIIITKLLVSLQPLF